MSAVQAFERLPWPAQRRAALAILAARDERRRRDRVRAAARRAANRRDVEQTRADAERLLAQITVDPQLVTAARRELATAAAAAWVDDDQVIDRRRADLLAADTWHREHRAGRR